MTRDITLYEFAPSRSKQARWTLLECGLEFRSVEGLEILHSEELNKVHPLGKVPAIVIDGEPLFEAAAICTYLADLVPEKKLIAPSGTRERALHLQWVSYCLTEMEAYLWSNARNSFVLPKEQRITALFKQNYAAYKQAAGVLNEYMADREFLVGDRFTVTDILVGFNVGWGKNAGLLDDFPHLQNYLARLKGRPHCTL